MKGTDRIEQGKKGQIAFALAVTALFAVAAVGILYSTVNDDGLDEAQPVHVPLSGTATIDITTPVVGDTLRATLVNGNVPSKELSYQWKADGVKIPYATNSTYTVKSSDLGKRISVTISHYYYIGSKTSAQTSPVLTFIPWKGPI